MVKELSVENHLKTKVEAAGGYCYKVMPVVAGLPDRLVVLPARYPGGGLSAVETKAPKGGEVRPAQKILHEKWAAIGVTVYVLWTSAQVDDWLADMTGARS